MQQTLSTVMGIDEDDVSIKATTTEKLGFTGREEGISAYATVLIVKDNQDWILSPEAVWNKFLGAFQSTL